MTIKRLARSIALRLRRFRSDTRGVSAVEFAMLLPLMMTLYLGGVELSQAVSADRKVTLVARTVADLVAQAGGVNKSDLSSIMAASSAVLAPYNVANAKVTVSSVKIDAAKVATVVWSDTLNGTKRSGDVTSLINTNLRVADTWLIWGEVSYSYKPTIGYVVTGTLTLKDQIFMRPRVTSEIKCTDC